MKIKTVEIRGFYFKYSKEEKLTYKFIGFIHSVSKQGTRSRIRRKKLCSFFVVFDLFPWISPSDIVLFFGALYLLDSPFLCQSHSYQIFTAKLCIQYIRIDFTLSAIVWAIYKNRFYNSFAIIYHRTPLNAAFYIDSFDRQCFCVTSQAQKIKHWIFNYISWSVLCFSHFDSIKYINIHWINSAIEKLNCRSFFDSRINVFFSIIK